MDGRKIPNCRRTRTFATVLHRLVSATDLFHGRASLTLLAHSVANVKATIPPENLLVLNLEKGFGWKDICQFLDKDIPDQPWPDKNQLEAFQAFIDSLCDPLIEKAMNRMKIVGSVIATAMALGAWYGLKS